MATTKKTSKRSRVSNDDRQVAALERIAASLETIPKAVGVVMDGLALWFKSSR